MSGETKPCEHCGVRESAWRDYERGTFTTPRTFEVQDRVSGEIVEHLTLCASCYTKHVRTTPAVVLRPVTEGATP